MSLFEILLIAFSLSLDAVVVAIAAGAVGKISFRNAVKIAAFFGTFQLGMPIFGWFIASWFKESFLAYGHIIGFVLLLVVGLKMLKESFEKSEGEEKKDFFKTGTLFILAIATSIDAFVIGMSLTFVDVSILFASTVIGAATLALSFIGVYAGKKGRSFFDSKIEIIGSAILIALAFKILLF
jgi:putative Mn2+ efflux pump MntP